MGVEFVSVTTNPESDVKIGHLPAMHIARRQVDVADWKVPVMVDVINKLICSLRTGFVRFMLSNFHLTGEERRIRALELVAHFNREAHRACIEASFVFGNLPAATFGFPPISLFDVAGVAVKFYPRSGGQCVFDVQLTSAGDGTIHSKLHRGHPTPDVVISLVDVERERSDLDRIFSDRWLVLSCRCVSDGRNTNHNKNEREGTCKPQNVFHWDLLGVL